MTLEMYKPDFGPLAGLIGKWHGDVGMDVSPQIEESSEETYSEDLVFEEVGDVVNADAQVLMVLRYHQVVTRTSDNQVFHDETGYWMWDAKDQTIMKSVIIPRGLALLAGGSFNPEEHVDADGAIHLEVSASQIDSRWGIAQSPFLQLHARTESYNQALILQDNTLSYMQTANLNIYKKSFAHTDKNTLVRNAGEA